MRARSWREVGEEARVGDRLVHPPDYSAATPRATLFVTTFRHPVQPVHDGLGIDRRQLLALKRNAHAALRRSDQVKILQAAVLRLHGLF